MNTKIILNDFLVPYCKICSACGEDGCCSPLSCQQHPDGEYCQRYLTDLKFAYELHERFIAKINDEKLILLHIKLFDELYEKYYNKSLTV